MSSSESTSNQNREKFTSERPPSDSNNSFEDNDFFGPALPPHLLNKSNEKEVKKKVMYGPVMPTSLSEAKKEVLETIDSVKEGNQQTIGPEIPEHLKIQSKSTVEDSDSDDNSHFGPSPNLMASDDVSNYYPLIGKQSMKTEESGESSTQRESWMLELPEEKAEKFGLGPRQFRTRILTEKERDQSVWTDTPGSKKKKQKQAKEKDHKKELKLKMLQERDKVMEKLAKKAAKKLKRKESLLEMHVKKMKKKEEKEKKKKGLVIPERRPFDRDKDLQIRRFDESQKRAIINKSLMLNDRFASGESKFL